IRVIAGGSPPLTRMIRLRPWCERTFDFLRVPSCPSWLTILLSMSLNRLDFAIIALYLTGITLFGLRFRKKQRTLRDYFLAGRDIPWWAIALSIVAAETSTLTIISIPGLAYDTNLTFLQVIMGYVVG